MTSLSEKAAIWFEGLRYDDIPDDVLRHNTFRVVDSIGLMLAASAMKYGTALCAGAVELGGVGPCSIVGFKDKVPAAFAALTNGAMAECLVFGDTHNDTIIHVSSSIVPTALALAEKIGMSGKDLLRLVVGGSELTCRIGLIARGQFHKNGFHPTGVIGAFGAAYVAAQALGLDTIRTRDALGLVGSFASGIAQSWADGTWAQLIHPGWAAQGGIVAATLAKNGAPGPAEVFEGTFGIFRTHVQDKSYTFDFDRLTRDIGTTWECRNISFKPYPSSHVIHPYLDAMAALMREGLKPEQIRKVTCPIAEYQIPVVAAPLSEKLKPATQAQARTSLQYSLAELLVTGALNGSSYQEHTIRDPAILNLTSKIEYVIDPDAPGTERYQGWVVVDTNDGRQLEKIEHANRGSAANPMSDQDVIDKFHANAAMAMTRANADRLLDALLGIAESPSINAVMSLCSESISEGKHR
jgi:2-methylcitrate dehydratase PrpD